MRLMFLSVPLLAGLAFAISVQAEVSLRVEQGPEDLTDSLRAASRLVAAGDPAATPAQDLIATARAEYGRILARLYELGYFGPVLSIRLDGREASEISAFRPTAPIEVVEIVVRPGERFRLGQARIDPLAPGTVLPDGFAPGEPAGTPILRQAAEAGVEAWRARGHAAARIADQRITARHGTATLDAAIRLDPGPVARFGRLVPEGEQRMLRDRIARIAGLPAGQRFDPATLTRVAGRLRDTGAFSSVALAEGPIGPDGTLDVTADLVEAPLRRLGFGAELSSTEGAMLSAYWLHRNLFGGAERLRFDGEISGLGGENGGFDALASASFARPATLSPDTTLEMAATLEHLDEVGFVTDSLEVSVGLRHWMSDTLEGAAGIGLSRVRVEDAFGEREVTMLSMPADLTWDSRDNAFDATGGWYLAGGLTPFAMSEGGGGARATLDARGYLSFGETDATRLAARVQAGTVLGGDIDRLPPDWLFYSGGAGTVRGQDYQSLGAIQTGTATGGRSFAGGSLELRRDLFDNWGAVVFADAGYVTADALWGGAGDWHSGAGIGLRYDTTVGPIRFDIAVPLGGGGSGVSFYIGIGQTF